MTVCRCWCCRVAVGETRPLSGSCLAPFDPKSWLRGGSLILDISSDSWWNGPLRNRGCRQVFLCSKAGCESEARSCFKELKCLHVVVSLHNANSYNSKAPNEACKTELKFSFGRCGGYKNMQRKGHMDKMEKWRGGARGDLLGKIYGVRRWMLISEGWSLICPSGFEGFQMLDASVCKVCKGIHRRSSETQLWTSLYQENMRIPVAPLSSVCLTCPGRPSSCRSSWALGAAGCPGWWSREAAGHGYPAGDAPPGRTPCPTNTYTKQLNYPPTSSHGQGRPQRMKRKRCYQELMISAVVFPVFQSVTFTKAQGIWAPPRLTDWYTTQDCENKDPRWLKVKWQVGDVRSCGLALFYGEKKPQLPQL